jgi:transmembrane sensor
VEHINDINVLIYKYIREEINEAELKRLNIWIESAAVHKRYFEEVKNVRELITEARENEAEERLITLDEVWQKVKVGLEFADTDSNPKAKVLALPWRRYVAIAASVLMITMAGIYFSNLAGKKTRIPHVSNVPAAHDAKPNTQHALLTLDDGSVVMLDSVKNGSFATQGNTRVQKLPNGQISYSNQKVEQATKILFNTVTVPKGSDVVHLRLSDGSQVWLNADSYLRYPVSFTGNERRVTINGEGFFKITKINQSLGIIPFIVSKDKVEVTVLGTDFNVNAYDNEDNIQVTLLEGKVRVKSEAGSKVSEKIIKPGEQTIVTHDGHQAIKNNADLEQVVAWKNGNFVFNRTNIQVVMRQIERWYDLETVYAGDEVKQWVFGGTISRYNNVSRVFGLLEETGSIHFKVEGKKVFVSPQ